MTPVVSLQGVGKRYRISSSRSSWIKDLLSPGKKSSVHEFWAVEDVNLEVERGVTLGILGRNGAGKSTLLRMISGVSRPTTGRVEVNGRLAAIFSTGAGFNPEFTGRDNVMLNGLILGIERDEMLARFDDIAAFADIGEFMDQPIKHYSSGMRSRLGFAVAVNVEADVLILDEALSAGDAAFKKKALQRMYDLRDSGTTVLFVTHSLGMVQRFCNEAALLHEGRLVSVGEPQKVLGRYRELLEGPADAKRTRESRRERQLEYAIDHEDEEDTPTHGETRGENSSAAPSGSPSSPAAEDGISRRATGGALVLGAELRDEDGEPVRALPSGTELAVRVAFQYLRDEEDSAATVVVRDAEGRPVFSATTGEGAVPLGPRALGERTAVEFVFPVPLRPGVYTVDASVGSPRDGGTCLSRAEAAATFEVLPPEDGRRVRGLVDLPSAVRVLDPAERDRRA